MKSYQQYCAVARSLDLVGDRWLLLIVRELLAFGPSRYSDLKRGLPGIASNLLAERLRTMESDGLLERHQAPPPIGAPVYQLTDRGRELEDVLRALTRWGLPSMPTGPTPDDDVQPQWIALLAGLTLPGQLSDDTEIILGIETGDGSVRVVIRQDGYAIERGLGASTDADVTLRGPAQLVGGALSGLLSLTRAKQMGLTITGRRDLLTGLVGDRRERTGGTR